MDWATTGILRRSAFAVVLAAGVLVALPQLVMAVGFTVRTVAVMGEQIPGVDPGVTLAFVGGGGDGSATINALGQVAFKGTVAGPTVDGWTNEAAFAEGPGGLALVLWELNHAPGTPPGVLFHCPSGVQYNDVGQALIFSGLVGVNQGGGLDCHGAWLGPPGGLALLARDGEPAPGTPSGVNFFNPFQALLFNNLGQAAFMGCLTGPGIVFQSSDHGIWLGAPGNLQLVARMGDPAPGTTPGVIFSQLFFTGELRLNSAGEALFGGQIAGPGIDATNEFGVWGGAPGNVQLRMQGGMSAPGAATGVIFRGGDLIGFNDAGAMSYRGFLTGPGVDVTNDTGIWSDASGTLALLAREGDQAPGTEPGVIFSTCFNNVTLGGSGRVVFRSLLAGPGTNSTNNQGLWAGDAAGLSLLARTGSHAPGMPAGVVFSSFFFRGPFINGPGEVAFRGVVTGQGVDGTNNVGLWSEVGGALRLIIRSGDALEVRPGDVRTVSDLLVLFGNSANQDGRFNPFNDAGQLAFAADFTDGSQGVFAATPVPPSCALLGDLTQDGVVDGRDIDGFLRAKLALPAAVGENEDCADFGTGDLAQDTAAFIGALLAGS